MFVYNENNKRQSIKESPPELEIWEACHHSVTTEAANFLRIHSDELMWRSMRPQTSTQIQIELNSYTKCLKYRQQTTKSYEDFRCFSRQQISWLGEQLGVAAGVVNLYHKM
jgi:hypothetical protein